MLTTCSADGVVRRGDGGSSELPEMEESSTADAAKAPTVRVLLTGVFATRVNEEGNLECVHATNREPLQKGGECVGDRGGRKEEVTRPEETEAYQRQLLHGP